jgi:hypothetical protein
VNHHACGIDDLPQAGPDLAFNLPEKKGMEMVELKKGVVDRPCLVSVQELFPKGSQSPSDRLEDDRSGVNLEELRHLRPREDLIDLRDLTQNLLALGGRHGI